MTQKIVKDGQCSECESSDLIRDEYTGELVCGSCGLVLKDELIDRSAEWRAFTIEEEEARSRTGPPTDYARFDKGLSTWIKVDRDASGRPLSSKTKRQMYRLKRWHIRSRIRESKSRNLMQAMDELERISEKLNIPSPIHQRAAMIYRKALDKNLVRGRSIDALIAASLYTACRLGQLPKSLDEISQTSTRDKKEVAMSYRLLLRRLSINMPVPDPTDYISKIVAKIGLSGMVQGAAVRLLRKAQHKGLTAGKDPKGVAAGLVYIAAKQQNEDVLQKHLAAAADITEVTLRKRYKELEKNILPDQSSIFKTKRNSQFGTPIREDEEY